MDIEHPREFLLTDQLALVPFIQERAKNRGIGAGRGLQTRADRGPTAAPTQSDAAWRDVGADLWGDECPG